MNLYENQEHQNSSKSLTTNPPAEKLTVFRRKITLKSNCKHATTDDIVRAQNKRERRKYFTY